MDYLKQCITERRKARFCRHCMAQFLKPFHQFVRNLALALKSTLKIPYFFSLVNLYKVTSFSFSHCSNEYIPYNMRVVEVEETKSTDNCTY